MYVLPDDTINQQAMSSINPTKETVIVDGTTLTRKANATIVFVCVLLRYVKRKFV